MQETLIRHETASGAPRSSAKPLVAFAYRPDRAAGVFDAQTLDRLASLCAVAHPEPIDDFSTVAARQALGAAEILITSWGCPRIDADMLAGAPRLKLIAHAAGTVKNFVTSAVFDAGIQVCNAASANAIPVAEFTLAAILFANKQVFGYRDLYRAQRAAPDAPALANPAVGNFGKTVGIVGYSRVGACVVQLLKPHDMDILLYDPHFPGAEADAIGVTPTSLDDLMGRSDVVSLHAPALEGTHHMIDAANLARMKDGATLINTARGAIVDQDALTHELVSGRISAVIDVTTPEVLPPDSPLYTLPNVLLTPHIAGALGNERARLGALAVSEVERYVRARPLLHAVAAETLHLQA